MEQIERLKVNFVLYDQFLFYLLQKKDENINKNSGFTYYS